jgi:hypothetical protein
MSRRILASALLLALALTSAGCGCHKTCAVRPAPCCPPSCPPGCPPGGPVVAPAVPGPPPVTAGFPPANGLPASHLR